MKRRPLELVVYERVPGRPGREHTYNSPDGLWAYPASHADGYALDKRLTAAELASEYWSQDAQCRKEQWIETVRGDDDYEDWERAMQSRMYERLSALHRFATMDDYDAPTETGTQA